MKSYIGFIVYNELCISPKLLYLTISHYRGWGGGQIQLFPNMVMLHIKFKGIESYSNMVANILPLDKPLTRRSLKVKLFFLEGVILYIKLKEMEHKIPCLPVCGEFCGLLMMIFPISLNPGQNFVNFFLYFPYLEHCILMNIY